MESETMEVGESIDTIHKEIAASREAIEQELATTRNDWYACFITRLTSIKNELELGNMGGEISDAKFDEVNAKVDALTEKVQGMRTKDRGAKDIDANTKDELFAELEALGQGL